MPLLRQGKEAARTGVGMRNRFFSDKPLADEVPHIASRAVFVPLVSEFLQVLGSNGAKLPKLGEGLNFGRAKPVGLPAHFERLSRLGRSRLCWPRRATRHLPIVLVRVAPLALFT